VPGVDEGGGAHHVVVRVNLVEIVKNVDMLETGIVVPNLLLKLIMDIAVAVTVEILSRTVVIVTEADVVETKGVAVAVAVHQY